MIKLVPIAPTIKMKKLLFFKKIIILLLLITLVTVSSIALKYYSITKDKHITIFVHGTILPGFALLNPYKSYTQTLQEDDLYIQCLKKIRSNPLIYEDCLMLQKGLYKVPKSLIKKYIQQSLTTNYSKKGAYQIIGAYNLIHTYLDSNNKKDHKYTDQDYYTFGFSGLLSNIHRKEASKELHEELLKLIQENEQQGYTVHMSLVCYSHGGNVALYLPLVQQDFEKRINIEELVLYGTPIQEETANYAKDLMFNRILNIYSEGDGIQTRDTFSTTSRQSYQTLSSFIDTSAYKHICDARILADKNPHLFGHLHFWCLNKYTTPFFWQKDTKAQAVIDALDPLPLVILTPIFISLVNNAQAQNHDINKVDISLKLEDSKFQAYLSGFEKDSSWSESSDILPLISKIQDYALKSWHPHACSSEVVRTGVGIWSAIQHVCGLN